MVVLVDFVSWVWWVWVEEREKKKREKNNNKLASKHALTRVLIGFSIFWVRINLEYLL